MLYFEFRSHDRFVSRKNNHEIKTQKKALLANFDLMKNAAIRRSNNSISYFDLMKFYLLTLTHKAESEFVMKKNTLPEKKILEKTFASFFFDCKLSSNFSANANTRVLGHDHLLELRLLEKSARHDFIIARHRSSNNIFSCQLLESS
jgi:hypothetical protein